MVKKIQYYWLLQRKKSSNIKTQSLNLGLLKNKILKKNTIKNNDYGKAIRTEFHNI